MRMIVFSVATLLAASSVPVAAVAAPAPVRPGWAQDGYGPANAAYNPNESVVNTGSVKRLKLRWTAVPKPGTEGCFDPATPVVHDGRMSIVDGDGVGTYELTGGRLLWRAEDVMDTEVGRTLVATGGLIVTTGWNCYGVSDPSGRIVALDAATGKPRWKATQGEAIERVVADGGTVVTYAACDVCDSTTLTAYRGSDGLVLWTRSGDGGVLANPVSAAGRLLVTGPGQAYAVSVATGRAIWRTPVRWSALAADPDGARFFAGDPTGALGALDAATGRQIWSVPAAAGALATDGRRVYVSRAGITAYDAATGRRLWHRDGVPDSRPVRAGGLLYVTGAVLSPVDGAVVVPGTGYGTATEHVVVADGHVLQNQHGTIRSYAP
jgi:outer membrane protein assembly factor BamB